MKIACLAWGSLVWDPRVLLIRRPWFNDGPFLPVEFCRQSQDGRMTLVITPGKTPLRTLWALSSVDNLREAIDNLGSREEIPTKNRKRDIGRWENASQPKDEIEEGIANWANEKRIEAVIWTALPSKFNGQNGSVPSVDAVVTYLKNLSFEKRHNAETYVRKAPIQIDTDYRRKIQTELGWEPQE
ncbi:MAG: hypothetical protein KAT58_04685 [candidate division Zixibacteria bacterium]|nr:hypothetical protein [candidate division Zixibacteria bacterium]